MKTCGSSAVSGVWRISQLGPLVVSAEVSTLAGTGEAVVRTSSTGTFRRIASERACCNEAEKASAVARVFMFSAYWRIEGAAMAAITAKMTSVTISSMSEKPLSRAEFSMCRPCS